MLPDDSMNWSPTRKVVAAAIAALVLWIVQLTFPDITIPIGIEGSLVVVIAYLIPDRQKRQVLEKVTQTAVLEVDEELAEG